MKFSRILLLVVLISAFAGAYGVATASALGFEDEPCPLSDPVDHQLKVCHPDAEVGKPYDLQIKGKGGCTPDFVRYDVIAGDFPPGLHVDSHTARVTGTPTTAGVFKFWLQVTDLPQSWCGDDKQSQWQFQITVKQGLQILQRQSTLTPGQIGLPYSMQFTTAGNTGTPSWSVSSGTLPAGLNLNSSNGTLSGTPTTAGDYSFKITATDSGRSDTQSYNMSVVQPLKAAAAAAPPAEVGTQVAIALAATGGRAPYTWTIGPSVPLPAGLTFDAAKGTISGTPTTAGTSVVKVAVTDSIGLSLSFDYTITVAPKVAIAKVRLRTITTGKKFSVRLAAVGGIAPNKWNVAAGKLPVGLRLNARTGVLAGTPRKAGSYRVTFQVTDKLGASAFRTFVLKVK